MSNKPTVSGFPSDLVPQQQKKQKSWILQVAKGIYSDKESSSIWNGESQYGRILDLRRVATGGKDIDKFKNVVTPDGNSAYLNLNYKQPSIIPPLVQNIVGGLTNQGQRVDVYALNPESRIEADKEKNKLIAIYEISKKADDIKEQTGIDPMEGVPKENTFASIEEIELYMKTTYKESYCVAMEDAIRFINEATDDEEVKKQLYFDLVVIAIAALRVYYDDNGDIQRRYVDPLKLITSFSESSDFKNIKYAGEFLDMEISDLESSGKLSFDELLQIAKSVAGKNGNPKWSNSWDDQYYPYKYQTNKPWGKFKIKVLDFEYISTDTIKKEKVPTKGNGYRLREMKDWKPKNKKNDVLEKRIKNIYEGKWVVGTNILYDYGLQRNMVRDKRNKSDVQLGFKIYAPNIYDMTNESIVERINPIDDEIIINKLKAQALVAKMRPQGVAVDVVSAAAAAAGLGVKNMSPRDLQDIFESSGTFYYASRTEDGRPLQQNPIYDLPAPAQTQLTQIVEYTQFLLQQVEYFTGIPMSTIASPDKDALVGIEKIKSLVRNTSLRFIQDAFENIYGRASKQIALMVQDSISNGRKVEEFGMAIGYTETDIIKLKKNVCLMDIGVGISVKPDAAELQVLENQINYALQAGAIKASDAIKVRRLAMNGSIEKAEMWLETYERQYEREKLQQSTAASEAQAQAQGEANAMMEQQKQQTEMMKMELEMQKMKLEKALESKQSTQDFVEEMKLQMQRLQGDLEKIKLATQEAKNMESKKNSEENIQGAFPKSTGMRQPKVPEPLA